MNTGKCITVYTITIKNGTESHKEDTVTIPQALHLLFSFSLESPACRNERDGDILLVAEDLGCGDLRQINFTGTRDDMKMLFWARYLFFAVARWNDRGAVKLIDEACRVNGYPIYRVLTESRNASNGRERIWLIMLLACGITNAKDHLRVIEHLRSTYRYTCARGSAYREGDLVSLLEWHLEDPTMPFSELMALAS